MTLSSKQRASLRSRAQKLDATLEVGKAGITDKLAEELNRQAKLHGLVKVGLRKSATFEAGRDVVAAELATRSDTQLVEVRGNTAVYFRSGAQAPVS